MEKEEMERGSVSYTVYMYYAVNAGWFLLLLSFIMSIINTGLSIGNNFWLSAWSEAGLGLNEVCFSSLIHVFIYLCCDRRCAQKGQPVRHLRTSP